MIIILKKLNRLNFFSLEGSSINLQLNGYLKIPPHHAYFATQPCETLISAKEEDLNDKLQGSVAAYLRCRGVVNKRIKKGLLSSLSVQKSLKS